MKCHQCNKLMDYVKEMHFNEYTIDGWKCSCGEVYFNPEQVQKILLLNKLKKGALHAKLGKIRSNLILRLPKDVETVLDLHQGEEVLLKVEMNKLEVIPA